MPAPAVATAATPAAHGYAPPPAPASAAPRATHAPDAVARDPVKPVAFTTEPPPTNDLIAHGVGTAVNHRA